MKIPDRIWDDVASQITSVDSANGDESTLRADESKRTVKLFGRQSSVEDYLESIDRFNAIAETSLTLSIGLRRETIPKEAFELKIIQGVWKPTEGVEVQFDDNGVSLTAGTVALQEIKAKIASIRSSIETVHIEGRSSLYCALVMKPAVTAQIEKCHEQENLVASFTVDVSAERISTHALTRQDARRSADVILGEVSGVLLVGL